MAGNDLFLHFPSRFLVVRTLKIRAHTKHIQLLNIFNSKRINLQKLKQVKNKTYKIRIVIKFYLEIKIKHFVKKNDANFS